MQGTLLFFCGKMGAGKSTKAKELASDLGAVLLSEDEWLAKVYPEEIQTFADYRKYSARLKPLLKQHVKDILNKGISVVMDFPGNTRKQRAWFKEIFLQDNIPHKLIYLQVEDAVCLEHLQQRRKNSPERSHFDTEEVFHQVTSYFEAPSEEEDFKIEVIKKE